MFPDSRVSTSTLLRRDASQNTPFGRVELSSTNVLALVEPHMRRIAKAVWGVFDPLDALEQGDLFPALPLPGIP